MSHPLCGNVITGLFERTMQNNPVDTDALLFRGRAADGTFCIVTFDANTVVLSRPVGGLSCRIRIYSRQYDGVAVIERADGHVIHLLHRDPGLSIDLVQLTTLEAAEEYCDRIASILDLPTLTLAGRSATGDTIVAGVASAPRRVRATAPRRPRFLTRRHSGEVVSFSKAQRPEVAALS
jgi:hypothetical protein